MWYRVSVAAMVVTLALGLIGCRSEGRVATMAAVGGTPGAGSSPTLMLSGTLQPGTRAAPTASAPPSLSLTATGTAPPSPFETLTGAMTPSPGVTSTTVAPTLAVTAMQAVSPSVTLSPTVQPTLRLTSTATVNPAASPTRGVSPTLIPTGTVAAGATLTATLGIVPGAPGQGPAQFMLRDLDSLEQFRSYRTTTVITWTPESGEETVFHVLREAMTSQASLSQDARYHTVVSLLRAGQSEGRIEFATANGQSWTLEGATWRRIPVSPETFLSQIGWLGNPQDLLKEDQPGRYIGVATVNGMATWHYHYGADAFRALDQLGQLDSGGADVWVHTDYRVLVRMATDASGRDQGGNRGRLQILSNLTDLNGPIQFALPPELEPTPSAPGMTPQAGQSPLLIQYDIPLLQGAADLRSLANVVIYRAQNSPAEVIAFYRARLQLDGWTVSEAEQGVGQAARFTRNGATVDIVAAPAQAANQATVIVVLGQGQGQ